MLDRVWWANLLVTMDKDGWIKVRICGQLLPTIIHILSYPY